MAAVYREEISRDRLVSVVSVVRDWLQFNCDETAG